MNIRITDFNAVKYIFAVFAVIFMAASLYFSTHLVKEMAEEERTKMELWADATRQIATAEIGTDFNFCLRVIEDNYTIPVIITDANGNPYQHRNIDIPARYKGEPDSTFLASKAAAFALSNEPILIKLDDETYHYLYYGDSRLLTQLAYYPWVQWGIILLFFIVLFGLMTSAKKAEQDRVWVGLSKETAHQLGTPISSLMAWVELMKGMEMDKSMTTEIEKDVLRLQTIANRFSKVGSKPELKPACLNQVVDNAASYMRQRASRRISLSTQYMSQDLAFAAINEPLFAWVIENLCKNAIDAMESGEGSILIQMQERDGQHVIDVKDTGKGIPKSKFKKVFEPGYTTKSRGWGLGLSLAKRIVEEYHEGKIFVLESELGKGTTFRIVLPQYVQQA